MSEMTETKEQFEHKRKRKIYDEFMSVWEKERQIQRDEEKRFNKGIFTLAAGSFGLSFAFINRLVPFECAEQKIILIVAWLFMGITLVLNMLDSRIAYRTQDRILDNIHKNIDRGYEGKDYEYVNRHLTELPTRVMKWAMIASLSMGILGLLYFVLWNTL